MIIAFKSAVIASLVFGSSNAFTVTSSTQRSFNSCSLHLQSDQNQDVDVNRRLVLQQTFASAASAFILPQWANADGEAWAPLAAASTSSTTMPVVDQKEVAVAKVETTPAVASSVSPSAQAVEKKEMIVAEATTQPPSFKSTPKYEKEIVSADASGASSSSTAVSSTAVKEKDVVKIAQQPAPAPAPAVVQTPAPPKPLTQESYALSIRQSTSALSTQLGHAFLVVDGLNTQARRLNTSTTKDHGVAVLEGMNVQAKRLQDDLTSASALYKSIIGQAKLISVPEESFEATVAGVTRASSVLDGVLVQSKRLVAASGGASTDEQVTYMLSVLDGLNTQVKRLNVKETFGLLDKLNNVAEKAS
jgi:hypothetical protein